MKKKNFFLILFAAVFILTAGIENALAYFTTYTEAAGGFTIELGESTTEIREEFSAWTKHVSITSDKDSEPVYIRVKAFCGSEHELIYDGAGKWSLGEGGYYYYSDILYGGGETEELLIGIGNIPETAEDASSFHVVVIYESTPVRHDENGVPYADWTVTLDTGKMEGGADQ